MAEEEYPLVDGEYPSWANVDCSVEIHDGESFQTRDWTKIDWSDKLEPGAIRGTGARKRARTRGEYDCDATVGLYIDKARQLMAALQRIAIARGITGIGPISFDIALNYIPLSNADITFGESGSIISVAFIGCRIKGRSGSNASSTDGSSIEFPLDVMDIQVDGISLV